jgi:hypothetical protein
LSGLLDGYLAALELLENVLAAGRRCLVAQEDVYKIESLDDRRVGDPEFFFDIADLALAAKENENEFLKVGRELEEKRNWQPRFYRSVALEAAKAADFQFAFANRASRNKLFCLLSAHF